MLIRLLVILLVLWSVQAVRWGPAYLRNHLHEIRAYWNISDDDLLRIQFGSGWADMVRYLHQVPEPGQALLFPYPIEGSGYFQFVLAAQIYPRPVRWTSEPEQADPGSYLFTRCGLPWFPEVPLHEISAGAEGYEWARAGRTAAISQTAEPRGGRPQTIDVCGLRGFRLVGLTTHGVILRRE